MAKDAAARPGCRLVDGDSIDTGPGAGAGAGVVTTDRRRFLSPSSSAVNGNGEDENAIEADLEGASVADAVDGNEAVDDEADNRRGLVALRRTTVSKPSSASDPDRDILVTACRETPYQAHHTNNEQR